MAPGFYVAARTIRWRGPNRVERPDGPDYWVAYVDATEWNGNEIVAQHSVSTSRSLPPTEAELADLQTKLVDLARQLAGWADDDTVAVAL